MPVSHSAKFRNGTTLPASRHPNADQTLGALAPSRSGAGTPRTPRPAPQPLLPGRAATAFYPTRTNLTGDSLHVLRRRQSSEGRGSWRQVCGQTGSAGRGGQSSTAGTRSTPGAPRTDDDPWKLSAEHQRNGSFGQAVRNSLPTASGKKEKERTGGRTRHARQQPPTLRS